jgi:hypothetical protein
MSLCSRTRSSSSSMSAARGEAILPTGWALVESVEIAA